MPNLLPKARVYKKRDKICLYHLIELPDESRIWVYQAERELNPEEQQLIIQISRTFIDQWATHGQPLIGSSLVKDGFFVIIAVDDHQLPSGCSIDASVGLIRDLGQKLQVDLFNRTNVPLWIDNKVVATPLAELKQLMKNGKMPPDTLLINTLVQQKSSLNDWIVPLKDSWLRRYLPQPQEN